MDVQTCPGACAALMLGSGSFVRSDGPLHLGELPDRDYGGHSAENQGNHLGLQSQPLHPYGRPHESVGLARHGQVRLDNREGYTAGCGILLVVTGLVLLAKVRRTPERTIVVMALTASILATVFHLLDAVCGE